MPKFLKRPLAGRRPAPTGLLVALAFALIGAGVVLFVFISSRPSGNPAQPDPGPGNVASFGELPENIGEATDITAVGDTREARFQVADKNDPSRVAMELFFPRLDMMGQGIYQTAEPRAWIYMKDGRTVFIRADSARIRRSSAAAAPESGEFSGNGVVLVFPPRDPDDTRPIDPLTDKPGLVGRFVSASFDTVLLELASQDLWTVETEQFWATGKGFLVRANQVMERLEFARIASAGEIRYRRAPTAPAPETTFVGPPPPPAAPAPSAPADTALAAATDPDPAPDTTFMGPPAPPESALAATKPPKEDLYLAEFRDGITLLQPATGRKLTSDLLSVWLRLLDNKLPEEAVGGVTTASARPRHALPTAAARPMPLAAQLAALVLAQTTAETSPLAHTLFTRSDEDIVLTWTGGVVIRPLGGDRPPGELAAGNHLHVRFTADRPGGQSRVTLTDRDTGAVGICAALDYAATLRELTLTAGAAENQADRVDFTVPATGRFIVPHVAINLASGVGQVRGGGTLLTLPNEDFSQVTVRPEFPRPADPDAPLPVGLTRQITWAEQADFKFRTERDKVTDALESAAFTGDVVARDRASRLSGRHLAADFTQTPDRKSALSRLRITGNALAIGRSTRGPEIEQLPILHPHVAAERLDVRFEPSRLHPGEDDATYAVASGLVRVGDRRGAIRADHLEAQLVRTEGNDYEAGEVRARSDQADDPVRIDMPAAGGGLITATAAALLADGRQRWAELTGDDVRLMHGSSLIRSTQVRLEEAGGRMEVFGAGALHHVQLDEGASESALVEWLPGRELAEGELPPPGVTLVHATWTRSMSFEDVAGRIECHGDASVTATSAEGGQISRSERLLIDITPGGDRDSVSASAHPAAPSSSITLGALAGGNEHLQDRRILRVESVGGMIERRGGSPASVKSWKFALAQPDASGQSAAGREYQQILYLEGPRIIVDEAAGTITVPEAGRGVTFDRGSGDAADDGRARTALSSGSGGRSQFTWRERMEFNRITGVLRMLRDVELRHLPIGSSDLVRMACDDLTARFDVAGRRDAELRTAEALGNVFAESGPRHLSSDRFTYDALSGWAIAEALGEDPVAMQDDQRAAPLLARVLRWDTRTDRVEIVEPAPIVVPLGR